MKLHENCLPCIVRQAVRTAQMTGAENREELYRKVFAHLARVNFSETAPELCGEIFSIVKEHIGVEDPYLETRKSCNALMLALLPELCEKVRESQDPFALAVKYAILGNIIDFSAPGVLTREKILEFFAGAEQKNLAIDESKALEDACRGAGKLLYIGDNCGEIVTDALLMEEIHRIQPSLKMVYAVRGTAVVNDVVRSDAMECGIDRLAEIIDNGDTSQGTALKRVSGEFTRMYQQADVIIAKGQANYESLSEAPEKKVFCLLMAKCEHIAGAIGVKPGSLAAFRLLS